MTTFNCIDSKVRLSAYLDGEVVASERLEIDRHLLECPECRGLFDRAEALDAAIAEVSGDADERDVGDAAASVDPLPPAFAEEILRRTRRTRDARRRWFVRSHLHSLGLLATAASMAIAATLLFVVFARSGGQPTPDQGSLVNDDGALDDVVYGPPRPRLAREDWTRILLGRDEAQALLCASQVLRGIIDMPVEDVRGRERLRQTAMYDELLLRLSGLDPKLGAEDRRLVGAAKAVLLEIQRAECQRESWASLQEDLRLLDLPTGLDSLVGRSDVANSV